MRSYAQQAIEGSLAAEHARTHYTGAAALPSMSDYFLGLAGKRSALVITLICAVFTVAAVVSLPNLDDGLLLLTMRELGSKAIVNAYPDNPLAGWLWRLLVESSGIYFWPLAVLLNAFLWWILALEACYLWIRLFPEHHGSAPLIGCLSIAPVIVHAQTILTLGPAAVLPSIVVYFSLFLILHYNERFGSAKSYFVPFLLLAFAGVSGDYGLSTGLALFVLLINPVFSEGNSEIRSRSRRLAWVSLIAIVASYVLFRFVFHLSSASVSGPASRSDFYTRLIGFPLNEFSTIWHVLVGAYGTLFGNFSVSWRSKTSLVSFLFGILFAWALTSKIVNGPSETNLAGQRVRALLLALVAGLVPVVLDRPYPIPGTHPLQEEAASRFLIPILPLAACLTVSLGLPLVRAQFRPVIVSILGLLIGYAALNQVWFGFRRQQLLVDVGAGLRPYVEAGAGQVVGVLSNEEICGTGFTCTAKATASWPVELSKRFWIYNRTDALDHLGSRVSCKSAPELQTDNQAVQRHGPIARALWVQVSGSQLSIEPYCLNAASLAKTSSPSVSASVRVTNGLIKGKFEHVKGSQDLTNTGTADWEHWTTASLSNHKASGNKQIAYYNTVGGVLVRDDANAPIPLTWNDGIPTETARDVRSGIAVGGHGNGFQIAAPADLTQRTLWVYVGVRKAESKIQVKMTDSSTDDYVDTSLSSPDGEAGGLYRITYHAGSPGQSLIITFTQINGNPQGSVLLQAAALAADGAQ